MNTGWIRRPGVWLCHLGGFCVTWTNSLPSEGLCFLMLNHNHISEMRNGSTEMKLNCTVRITELSSGSSFLWGSVGTHSMLLIWCMCVSIDNGPILCPCILQTHRNYTFGIRVSGSCGMKDFSPSSFSRILTVQIQIMWFS